MKAEYYDKVKSKILEAKEKDLSVELDFNSKKEKDSVKQTIMFKNIVS